MPNPISVVCAVMLTALAPLTWADDIDALCQKVGNKLGSVSVADCRSVKLTDSGHRSVNGTALALRDFPPMPERRESLGKVLMIGGIHGDEYSAVSIVFKWLAVLDQYHSGLFHWRIAPVSNPDGLLRRRSQRMNENGVDLNRNFPTENWDIYAPLYWESTYKNKRRYPGPSAASEPETRWMMEEIKTFDPDVIVQVHAPIGIVDFDGRARPPERLGNLSLRMLGVYPGSMGNFGGIVRDIPVVTIELPSAGSLPSSAEQKRIWSDLVIWLERNLPNIRKAREPSINPEESTQHPATK